MPLLKKVSERERRGLGIFLRQAIEFRLALALYNDLEARDAFIRKLAEELASEGLRILTLDLRTPSAEHTLLGRVKELVESVPTVERLAIMVVNIEEHIDLSPELSEHGNRPHTAFIETANFHRELFATVCPGPLVIWMNELLERAFVRHAPDLWHWRSHVFDFRTEKSPALDGQFEYDVFISYCHNDKEWVRGELLKRIEQAGLKALIDFRDFTRGAPSIKEMERGLETCPKTLLVLSPDYIADEWFEVEKVMIQTLNPTNRALRLIPLLKAECDKPRRIGAITHIDFTDGADHELAWRQLLIALGKPPVLERPREPQRDEWFLAHPYAMPPNFTGRVAERAMLDRWLNEDSEHPLLSLRALGGFGKSP